MCGIAGKANFNGTSVNKSELDKMLGKIIHRGPDDSGFYVSPDSSVGFGHRRLSIIDLSRRGRQPMKYKNRYVITYNGEMYNFREKRSELLRDGYEFNSHSDTEVILALYDKYGVSCLKHIRGMFAFAIYDEKHKTIFCARDRLGQKPFKYYIDHHTFLFASELKAILTQNEYNRTPDYIGIHHYLTYQYCPAPYTGFLGIKKLKAAHYLLVNTNSGKVIERSYWNVKNSKKLHLSKKTWNKKILDTIDNAVRLRMVSDVPLGAFLSGGIDSSAVVAFMARHSERPVKTFTIGFKEEAHNELAYAKLVAQFYNTEHTEFVVEPRALEILPLLIRQYEEPFADSSAIPTYYVSKLARENVKVALTGDGADESFGGYQRYIVHKLLTGMGPRFVIKKLLAGPAFKLANLFSSGSMMRRVQLLKEISSISQERGYAALVSYMSNLNKQAIYTERMMAITSDIDSYDITANRFEATNSGNSIDKMLFADTMNYLPDALLTKLDMASMAVSLEARSPFLDHKLVELANQIPASLKLRGFNANKYILRQALRNVLPNQILRRKKHGFSIPLNDWLRGELRSLVYDTLLSRAARDRDLFNPKSIQHILKQHNNGINWGPTIWVMLMLELWFNEYFD